MVGVGHVQAGEKGVYYAGGGLVEDVGESVAFHLVGGVAVCWSAGAGEEGVFGEEVVEELYAGVRVVWSGFEEHLLSLVQGFWSRSAPQDGIWLEFNLEKSASAKARSDLERSHRVTALGKMKFSMML